jgi:hypothetical protein
VDEYQLWVLTAAVGQGQPLFTGLDHPLTLRLVACRAYAQLNIPGGHQRDGDSIGRGRTSPQAIGLAEHRLGFGVGHELPDLLRAAACASGLGSPFQRLLA